MRFQKRIKVFPGVRLNLSASGVSTTVGVRGAGVTLGKRGAYVNVGIPGTGISHRQKLGKKGAAKTSSGGKASSGESGQTLLAPASPIQSASPQAATSPGLAGLHETLRAVYAEHDALKATRQKAVDGRRFADGLLLASRVLIIGFVVSWFKEFSLRRGEQVERVDEAMGACQLDIGIDWNQALRERWERLDRAFGALQSSEQKWDITARGIADRVPDGVVSSGELVRVPVGLSTGEIPHVVGETRALHLENANGADLFIYPGFLMLLPNDGPPGVVDIREVEVEFQTLRVMEEQPIAGDARVVDQAWFKSNKDGSRDRRFKDNYQIPVVEYASLHVKSPGGVNELFCFSDVDGAARFVEAFGHYQAYFSAASAT